jgi:hypothetical protein
MYLHVLQLNIFIAKDESSPNQVAGIPTKEIFTNKAYLVYQFLTRYFGTAFVILRKMHFIL